MYKNIKYTFTVQSNFHLKQFLSINNRTNDSFFWTEISDMDDKLYFSSTLLNDMQDHEEIYHIANQIISIYEGIYKLLDRTKHNSKYFILRELYHTDSRQLISKGISTELYKIDIDFSSIREVDENKPIHPIYILFEKIVKDEFLKNLFFLLSNKVDYRMLYIIYDDIRFFLKSNEDNNFLKPFENELNRFTHTANNFEVLGFFARHGRTNHHPPKKPMNITDSMNLIFDIIVKLLEEKFEITLPKF